MQATKTRPTQTHNGPSETQRIRKAYAMEISRNSDLELNQIQRIVSAIPEKDRTGILRWMAWFGGKDPEQIIRLYQDTPRKISEHFESFETFTNRRGR